MGIKKFNEMNENDERKKKFMDSFDKLKKAGGKITIADVMKDAGIEAPKPIKLNTKNLKLIEEIEYYDFDKKLDKDIKSKFEEYLTKRMKEETKKGRFQFKSNIDLKKTKGIVCLYKDKNNKNVYWFAADCDYYVFEAEIWLTEDGEFKEDVFGTSLSE
jgi:hypothetical protein